MGKGEQTRQTIVTEALRLASELGLESLTIGELARTVGMSKSGLFAHFRSKEQLQLSVLQEAVQRFVETVITPALREPRGEPRVRALYRLWLAWENASYMPGGCIFMTASVELDHRPGAVRDYLVSTQKDWVSILAQAARIAQQEGQFRDDLDPEDFAFELQGINAAYHRYSRLLSDDDARRRADRAFEALLRRCH